MHSYVIFCTALHSNVISFVSTLKRVCGCVRVCVCVCTSPSQHHFSTSCLLLLLLLLLLFHFSFILYFQNAGRTGGGRDCMGRACMRMRMHRQTWNCGRISFVLTKGAFCAPQFERVPVVGFYFYLFFLHIRLCFLYYFLFSLSLCTSGINLRSWCLRFCCQPLFVASNNIWHDIHTIYTQEWELLSKCECAGVCVCADVCVLKPVWEMKWQQALD